jgi:hypothetical protein
MGRFPVFFLVLQSFLVVNCVESESEPADDDENFLTLFRLGDDISIKDRVNTRDTYTVLYYKYYSLRNSQNHT